LYRREVFDGIVMKKLGQDLKALPQFQMMDFYLPEYSKFRGDPLISIVLLLFPIMD